MRLSRSSDVALRLMMLLAQQTDAISIQGAAASLRVPKSQIMKVAAALAGSEFIETRRGRGGGIRLKRPAREIRIGAVVRAMESEIGVVDCMRAGPCDCVFMARCGLIGAMNGATHSFFDHLDAFTLSEMADRSEPIAIVA